MEILILNINFSYEELTNGGITSYFYDDVIVEYKAFDDKNEIKGKYKNPERYKPDALKREIAESLKEFIAGREIV